MTPTRFVLLLLLVLPLLLPTVTRADDAEQLLEAARRADAQREWSESLRQCNAALEQDAELASGYYWRGRARFCLSKFDESVADFDQYVKRTPAAASRQWERGIACYYADKFQAGAEQFALYQTYHDNDVENSVWRYLCMARMKDQGLAKARAAILPIRNDRRPGMMKIYDLYRGKATIDEVLADLERDEPTPKQLSGRLFYARLYIGLYFEAQGDAANARKYIDLAADKHPQDAAEDRVNHFMYDVAVVHQKKLRDAAPPAK